MWRRTKRDSGKYFLHVQHYITCIHALTEISHAIKLTIKIIVQILFVNYLSYNVVHKVNKT